jgi:hypothetical protein
LPVLNLIIDYLTISRRKSQLHHHYRLLGIEPRIEPEITGEWAKKPVTALVIIPGPDMDGVKSER